MTSSKNSRILIVEDETIIAEDLKTFLEDKGYNIVGVVNTGQAALDVHLQLKPDLVVMDIILDEDMNGIEAANKMQETQSTPILFLTALRNEVVIKNLKNVTFYQHIMKPFKDSDLLTSIESMLKKKEIEIEEINLNNRIKQILNQISEGIVILGENGKITLTNHSINNICGTSDTKLLTEALYYFESIDQEENIKLQISNRTIPCKAKSINLNWDNEYSKMLVLRDISEEEVYQKKIDVLTKKNSFLEKKFGVGTFLIEFKEDPKIIDANSEFLKKLKFIQYSDIHSKKFLNLLPEKKNFQLLIKKLQDNPIISGQEITLIDQKGQPLNANINLELQYLDNNSQQIAGQVFFLD